MINYLLDSTSLDIAIAIYEVDRFSIDPKHRYKKATIKIARYLKFTSKLSIFCKLEVNEGIEVYIDTNFARI